MPQLCSELLLCLLAIQHLFGSFFGNLFKRKNTAEPVSTVLGSFRETRQLNFASYGERFPSGGEGGISGKPI